MSTINTNDLRVKNAENLIASFNDGEDANSYVFVGRVQPWADDNAPPPPQNNFREFYSTYDDIFALRRISTNNAVHMIFKTSWVSGVTYDRYQHNYTSINKSFSGASNLYDAKYYVINSLNYVYVCLDNNNNTPSTDEPRSSTNSPFFTSDGYQWMRVFNISNNNLLVRSTNNLMPIAPSDTNSQPDGAVYTVLIDTPGAGYTINPAGVSNQVTEYYAHISGDGTGAVAKVSINSSSVSKVEVVRNGTGYTYGQLEFVSGKVYQTLTDLDNAVNGLNPLGDGSLRTTVIISPPGGWGSDLPREFGGIRVGVFVSLDQSTFRNYFPCPFRQIGILQDFTFDRTTSPNPGIIQACYAIKVDGLLEGQSFLIGEKISQEITEGSVVNIAQGTVVAYDQTNNVIRYVQNSDDVDTDGNLYRFSGPGTITGETSGLTDDPEIGFDGKSSDLTFVAGYSTPIVTPYTGLMTYLTNISPVVRDAEQSERIGLVIAF